MDMAMLDLLARWLHFLAGVIWVAYWRISSGASTVGDFMGLTAALLMAAQPLKAVGGLTARIQEGHGMIIHALCELLEEALAD